MGIITYTREAKCKDCEFIRYYYKGKCKRHMCTKNDEPIILNNIICDSYLFRKISFYPKRLLDNETNKNFGHARNKI